MRAFASNVSDRRKCAEPPQGIARLWVAPPPATGWTKLRTGGVQSQGPQRKGAAGAGAPQGLRDAAESFGLTLHDDPGGAAFYAPKISVQARDAIGRYWQMSTIQVDLMLPDRFELEYTSSDGSRQRPVMIHRALFGSIERFFGVLTEHYAGAFPAWLAPVQVVGIPVTEAQDDYVRDIAARLRAAGIRIDVDSGDDRMQKKIRTHTLQKVPFLLLVGGRDVEAGAVSFRFRDGSQTNAVPVEQAVTSIIEWVRSRTNTSPTAESFGVGA